MADLRNNKSDISAFLIARSEGDVVKTEQLRAKLEADGITVTTTDNGVSFKTARISDDTDLDSN